MTSKESPARAVSVLAQLTSDHHRLDERLAEALAAASRQRWSAAAKPLGEFTLGLSAEIHVEEHLLFPRFLAAGGGAGVVGSLLAEHQLLRRAALGMQEALARKDALALAGMHDRLMSVLTYHELKEERGVFAELDRRLSAGERAELVARVAIVIA